MLSDRQKKIRDNKQAKFEAALSKHIKEKLLDKMSIKDLAELSGIARPNVHTAINGKKLMSFNRLFALCHAAKLDLEITVKERVKTNAS